MTKSEYLSNLKKKADKSELYFSKKGKRRHTIIGIILVIGTVLSIGFGIKGTESENKIIYDAFIADHSQINYEHLNYRDTFEIWNNSDIGNDVNVLLSGGKIYSRADIAVHPDKNGEYCVFHNNAPIKTLGHSISFINVIDDIVFYREDETRNLISYKINSDRLQVLVKGNVGEVFATEDRVYYIDLKNGTLVSINLIGRDRQTIYDYPVNSYAVCGKNIFVLDNNKRFGIYRISSDGTGHFSTIASNVERFFINGNVVAESGNTIFTFRPTGGKAESVYESYGSSMRLVGMSDSIVFFQEDGILYALIEGTKIPVLDQTYALYQSILRLDDWHFSVVATKDTEAALASNEVLTFEVK